MRKYEYRKREGEVEMKKREEGERWRGWKEERKRCGAQESRR